MNKVRTILLGIAAAVAVSVGAFAAELIRPSVASASNCGYYCGGVSCRPTSMDRQCNELTCENDFCF